MALIICKPTSPGRRFVIKASRDGLYKGRPEASLLTSQSKHAGRNNTGRITTRHQGGGHKQHYRLIDFKRVFDNIPALVEHIEYDPNRTAYIALLKYKNGARTYIIAPKDLKAGDEVISGVDAPIKVGNSLPLKNVPVGTFVHCVEMKPLKGAQLARSAGASVQLIAKDGPIAIVRLRSGEMRKVPLECRATIGIVSNSEHNLISLGKAGAKRWRGVRPTVRGVVMNPIDHPHGGGEGKTAAGRHPVSPWGQKTKGYKTRKNKRTSNMIMQRRKKK